MKQRMMRCSFLYSPAFVCALWAVLFWAFGRTDALVIFGCCVLAVSLTFHTYQVIKDHEQKRGRLR